MNTKKQSENATNIYDDDNIPEVDLPRDNASNATTPTEPLPESSRPRKDGPGGD